MSKAIKKGTVCTVERDLKADVLMHAVVETAVVETAGIVE